MNERVKLKWRVKWETFVAKTNQKIYVWELRRRKKKKYKKCWIDKIGMLNGTVDEIGNCYGWKRYDERFACLAGCKDCPYSSKKEDET